MTTEEIEKKVSELVNGKLFVQAMRPRTIMSINFLFCSIFFMAMNAIREPLYQLAAILVFQILVALVESVLAKVVQRQTAMLSPGRPWKSIALRLLVNFTVGFVFDLFITFALPAMMSPIELIIASFLKATRLMVFGGLVLESAQKRALNIKDGKLLRCRKKEAPIAPGDFCLYSMFTDIPSGASLSSNADIIKNILLIKVSLLEFTMPIFGGIFGSVIFFVYVPFLHWGNNRDHYPFGEEIATEFAVSFVYCLGSILTAVLCFLIVRSYALRRYSCDIWKLGLRFTRLYRLRIVSIASLALTLSFIFLSKLDNVYYALIGP